MRIVLGSRIFTKTQFKDENELEKVVRSNSRSIFGEDIIYIPQKSLETAEGFGTVPEAIVISLSAKKWGIVEVELASHDLWSHIVRQVMKQIAAADNPEVRREITKIALSEIEKSPELKKKLAEIGISDMRIHNFLQEIMDNDPMVILPIDFISEDMRVMGKALKKGSDFVPVKIEKYVAGDEVEYRIDSDIVFTPPEEEEQPVEKPVTPAEFLKQCDEPGRIFYRRLEELAKEKRHKFEPRTEAFSYNVIRRSGEKFCPLTLWPKWLTIIKWNLIEKNGITSEALSAFREDILKVSALANKYDTMKEPNLSIREGDISTYEIDLFISAFKKLVESIS